MFTQSVSETVMYLLRAVTATHRSLYVYYVCLVLLFCFGTACSLLTFMVCCVYVVVAVCFVFACVSCFAWLLLCLVVGVVYLLCQ